MKTEPDNTPCDGLTKKVTSTLDQSLNHTRNSQSRLAEMRTQALAEIPKAPPQHKTVWLAAGSLATIVIAALLFTPALLTQKDTSELAELEWLIDNNELDILEADLEFYQWAEGEMEGAG